MEMGAIGPVLRDDLRMSRLVLRTTRKLRVRAIIRVRVGVELRELVEQVGQLPLRLLAVRLVPGENAAVLLANGVHAQPQRLVGPVGLIRDVAVGPIGSPAPPVKRAFDAVADHLAAVPDVGTEMLAVS